MIDNRKDGARPGYIESLVCELVSIAKQHVSKVDLIILPELALDDETYDSLISQLVEKFPDDIQIVIAGVKSKKNEDILNVARTTYFIPAQEEGEPRDKIEAIQKKHHRWKLDQSQIKTYSLGDSLDPNKSWWEYIDITCRHMDFFVFRKGACFTTLICEDLARIDPCQTAIRAIGPNLVFALLMDGPQIKGRWPERYALSLSDDPGSSVLSVTSLGLVERSNIHYDSNKRAVALWKDLEAGTTEITLPVGHHGILLNLTGKNVEEFTLDGRTDNKSAINWVLTGKIPLKLSS